MTPADSSKSHRRPASATGHAARRGTDGSSAAARRSVKAPRREETARRRATRPLVLGPDEHDIPVHKIHPNIMWITQRLQDEGFEALVVGGAVRDLLQGRVPKDYDVATTAAPDRVKGLFRNARIIGRRFRLVLLEYPDMTVEVSTFRGPAKHAADGMILRDNAFGTPEQDAFRRDFTFNALFYDPIREAVIDHVGGMEDLHKRRIRTIVPPEVSFREDPVRMLRAVRFKVRLGFQLERGVARALHGMAPHLAAVTRHRLAEECQRFLTTGYARDAFAEFRRVGLLAPLLALDMHPGFFAPAAVTDPVPVLTPYLESCDRWAAGHDEPIAPTVALLGLLTTLARPEFRQLLLGNHHHPARRRSLLMGLRDRLPALLAEWGFLNGQVEPALHILLAARALLRRREGPVRLPARPLAGTREAWMLLALLQPVLELNADFVAQGVALMDRVPPLPILDHPRPRTRPTVGTTRRVGLLPRKKPSEGERPRPRPRGPRRRGRRR